jgi:hypothetical protein
LDRLFILNTKNEEFYADSENDEKNQNQSLSKGLSKKLNRRTVEFSQGHLHPLHRASGTGRCVTRLMRRSRESNPGPPGEHSMQRAIRTASLSTISEPQLYYYSSPPSRDVASSRVGIVAESGGPNSKATTPYAELVATPL